MNRNPEQALELVGVSGDVPSSVAIAAELGRRLHVAQHVAVVAPVQDAKPFVILRDAAGEEKIVYVEERFEKPARKRGTIKLLDAESFVRFYAMQGNGAPVYASLQPVTKFTAVLNEHGPRVDEVGWRDYLAVFEPTHSEEWKVWTSGNGRKTPFSGTTPFAEFIEANSLDFVEPSAARMLEIATNFKVHSDVRFAHAQNMANGQVDFNVTNAVTGEAKSASGGKLSIPATFKIKIPVFAGLTEPRYELVARFRYRLQNDGALSLWYELEQPQRVLQKAFLDVWKHIEEGTKAKILHGIPNAVESK